MKPESTSRDGPRRGLPHLLRVGCLTSLLLGCGVCGFVTVAAQSGPVTVSLPVAGVLRLGSEQGVLTRNSFQNGTTYFVDLKGGGVRNILQVNYLQDNKQVEVVLKRAERGDRSERHIVTMPVP